MIANYRRSFYSQLFIYRYPTRNEEKTMKGFWKEEKCFEVCNLVVRLEWFMHFSHIKVWACLI